MIIKKFDNLIQWLETFSGEPLRRYALMYLMSKYAILQFLVELGERPAHLLYHNYWISELQIAKIHNNFTFDYIYSAFGNILLLNIFQNITSSDT